MNSSKLRVLAVILLVLYLIIGLVSFLVVRTVISSELMSGIPVFNKVILFSCFIVGLFIVIAFTIIIIRLTTENIDFSVNNTNLGNTKKTKKKETLREQEEENQKKNEIISELMANLSAMTDLEEFADQALINISKKYDIMQGVFFVKDDKDEVFRKQGAYAYFNEEELREFKLEVGLSGQVAEKKELLNLSNIPEKYITVLSGLGKSSPGHLLIVPIIYNDESVGVIELASFKEFNSFAEEVFMELSKRLGELIIKLKQEKSSD